MNPSAPSGVDVLRFEVRDDELPDWPPLTWTDDYSAALAEVERLHEQFRDQLEANGEGGGEAWQRLSITLVACDGSTHLRYVSAVNGIR